MTVLLVSIAVWVVVMGVLAGQVRRLRAQRSWAPIQEPFVTWVKAAVVADRSLTADELEEAVKLLLLPAAPPRRHHEDRHPVAAAS